MYPVIVSSSKAGVKEYDSHKNWGVDVKHLGRFAVMLALLAMPGVALAVNSITGTSAVVPAGESRTGTFFAAGTTVTIAGTIDGDLVCAGSNVKITGTVHGDVLCAGQILTLTGTVDGSVRAVGQMVSLGGSVGRNVTAAGQSITTASNWVVTGDAGIFAQTATFDGRVAKEVYGAIQNVRLEGETGGLSLALQQLELGDSAKVNGNIWYTSGTALSFDRSRITGNVTFQKLETAARRDETGAGFAWRLYWMAASLTTALVLFALIPHRIERLAHTMLSRPVYSMGWGLAVVLAAPAAITLAVFSFLGLPLALMAGALFGMAVFTSPILAGTAAAMWLLQRLNRRPASIWWAGLLGIIVISAVIWTPVVGVLVWLLSLIWSIGGLLLTARSGRAKSSATA